MFLMAFCSVVLGSSGCCSLADGCDGGARAAGRRLDGMTPIRLMPLETGLSLLSTKGNEANYYSKLGQKDGNVRGAVVASSRQRPLPAGVLIW